MQEILESEEWKVSDMPIYMQYYSICTVVNIIVRKHAYMQNAAIFNMFKGC